MRKAKLLSTVAAALLLSVGAASAQGMGKDTPERAPAAQQSAPAEKVAPSMKGEKAQHEKKAPETTGQATPDAKSGKASETTGQAPKADTSKSGASSTEKSDMNKKSDTSSGANAPAKTDQNAASPNSSSSKSTQSTTEQNRAGTSTTGQGAAAGSAKLTTEQRTKISTVIRQHRVEPAHLNVSVSVGTRVPTSVHVYPLPAEVVTIYPEWRGYNYIFVGEEIVIIDPHTHEIVFIIEA